MTMRANVNLRHQYTRRAAMATFLVVGITILFASVWIIFTARTIRSTHFENPGPSTAMLGQWETFRGQIEGLWRAERVRLLFMERLQGLQQQSVPPSQ